MTLLSLQVDCVFDLKLGLIKHLVLENGPFHLKLSYRVWTYDWWIKHYPSLILQFAAALLLNVNIAIKKRVI